MYLYVRRNTLHILPYLPSLLRVEKLLKTIKFMTLAPFIHSATTTDKTL